MAENYESSVIGSILIDPKLLKVASDTGLEADDFSVEPFRIIYREAMKAEASGTEWNSVDAAGWVHGKVPDEVHWIMDLMKFTVTLANLKIHAEKVRDAARLARMRRTVTEMLIEENGDDIATGLIKTGKDYLDGEHMDENQPYSALSNQFFDNLNEDPKGRIDTGWPMLDEILRGMWPGNLILIGARPGTGKSAFALNIAEHAAATNGPVLLFSMEMQADEVFERSAANAADVTLGDYIEHNMDKPKWDRTTYALNKLMNLPLYVNDRAAVTVSYIRRMASRIDDLKLIIVDYAGLMRGEGKSENRNLELGGISRELKILASDLKVPIVALAQLNRQRDEFEQPKLSDLRDSGELEQNANKILFLWNLDKDQGERIGVSVAKNRRGAKGALEFKFKQDFMRFSVTGELVGKARAF